MKKTLLVCVLAFAATAAFAKGGGAHGGGSHGGGHVGGESHGGEGGHEPSGWHEEEPPSNHSYHFNAAHASNASDAGETGDASFWHNVMLALFAGFSALLIVMIVWR